MSDREEVLRGTIRQIEREAAATELYLKAQIRQLKEQINEDNKQAFEGGWVARDAGALFSEVDDWYAAWVEDEEGKL